MKLSKKRKRRGSKGTFTEKERLTFGKTLELPKIKRFTRRKKAEVEAAGFVPESEETDLSDIDESFLLKQQKDIDNKEELFEYAINNTLSVTKVLVQRDFTEFVKYFWDCVSHDELHWNWHIDVIAEKLMETARQVGKMKPKLHDVVINIPPGMTKSLLCTVMFPVWCWLPENWPWMKFICASYGADLSLEQSDLSRDLLKSPKFKQLFPEIRIRKDKDTKSSYKIEYVDKNGRLRNGGTRFTTSVGGTVTGMHGHILIVDDPLKPDEAASEKGLKTANDWMDQTLSMRKVDKEIVPTILVMQRLHECLLPTTKINTINGLQKIQDLKLNDIVETSKGFQKVLGVFNKDYVGKIIGIKKSGHPEVTWVTDNHLVFTNRGWIKAGKLSKKDTLVVPFTEYCKNSMLPDWPKMPIRNKAPKIFRPKFNGNQYRVPYEKLKELVNSGLTSTEIAKYFGFKNRQCIDLYIAKYGLIKQKAKIVSSEIVQDKNFWRIVGYWLAEGSLVKGRRGIYGFVRFSFGNKDGCLIKDTKKILNNYNILIHTKPTKVSTVDTYCSSYQLALFLQQFGLGAKNKRMPSWAFHLPKEYFAELLHGYWLGDGSTIKNSIRITSVSLQLLTDIQNILLRFGVVSSIYQTKTGRKSSVIKTGIRKGCIITGGVSYELRVLMRDINSNFWPIESCEIKKVNYIKKTTNQIENNTLFVKIRDLQIKEYDGLVYDITTPCHNFISPLIKLHNSDPTGHTLAKKKKNVYHICLPGELGDYEKYVQPPELVNKYKNGLLDEKRLSRKALEESLVNLGQYGYAGQIGQNPVPPGGGMFQVEMLNIVETIGHVTQTMRAWDKACLLKGTKISTNKGLVPIELVKVGDLVLTRDGYKKVTNSWLSKYTDKITTVLFSNGSSITGTPDHRIWSVNKNQWVELQDLEYTDVVFARSKGLKPCATSDSTASGSKIIGKLTGRSGWLKAIDWKKYFFKDVDIQEIPKEKKLITDGILGVCFGIRKRKKVQNTCCTEMFGLQHMEVFPKAIISTIKMKTGIITTSQILSAQHHCNTEESTKINCRGKLLWQIQNIEKKHLQHYKLGCKNLENITAFTVEKSFTQKVFTQNTVVNCVAEEITQNNVIPVYDLTVEDAHEFFANGVLVHNSSEESGAYTVGVKMSRLTNGKFLIEDVKRKQVASEKRELMMRSTAEADGKGVIVIHEQEPGSGGKDSARATTLNLAGFSVITVNPSKGDGDKIKRADPFSVQVNSGNVLLLRGEWNADFKNELQIFPFGKYKDQVDAASIAFNKLSEKRMVRRLC